MVFSDEWEGVYQRGAQNSVWPWSDLVSFVMRYAPSTGQSVKVLELGCGAGANIPFFESLDVQYFGIEGSPSVVERLRERFPSMLDRIVVGDFTLGIPFDAAFDLVVDRSSITHNTTADIVRCLDSVYRCLRSGGIFIGIDWFSTSHSAYLKEVEIVDSFTRSGYRDGPFADVGRVHFSDEEHLVDLFRRFEPVALEQKTIRHCIPRDEETFAAWNLAVRKI